MAKKLAYNYTNKLSVVQKHRDTLAAAVILQVINKIIIIFIIIQLWTFLLTFWNKLIEFYKN